jgi:hypothetical protein
MPMLIGSSYLVSVDKNSLHPFWRNMKKSLLVSLEQDMHWMAGPIWRFYHTPVTMVHQHDSSTGQEIR